VMVLHLLRSTWRRSFRPGSRLRKCCTAACAAGAMLIGGQAAFAQSPAAFTGWDFEDGTLQGWTVVSAPTLFGPTGYEATRRTFFSNERGVDFWAPLGYISENAGYAAAATPFDDRALPHDAPLVLRSPTFALQESGQIIAH